MNATKLNKFGADLRRVVSQKLLFLSQKNFARQWRQRTQNFKKIKNTSKDSLKLS